MNRILLTSSDLSAQSRLPMNTSLAGIQPSGELAAMRNAISH